MKTIKKSFFLLILVLVSNAGYSQQIPKEIKENLQIKLRHLIENFEGTYLGNVTIDEVNNVDRDGSIEIRGKVSYEGSMCGEVRATYRVEIDKKGYDKVCILTPICSIFGGEMRKEWDCSGKKWGNWQSTTRQIMQAIEKTK